MAPIASVKIPLEYPIRAPFQGTCEACIYFSPYLKDNIGKAEKPVLAATARIMAVENWKT